MIVGPLLGPGKKWPEDTRDFRGDSTFDLLFLNYYRIAECECGRDKLRLRHAHGFPLMFGIEQTIDRGEWIVFLFDVFLGEDWQVQGMLRNRHLRRRQENDCERGTSNDNERARLNSVEVSVQTRVSRPTYLLARQRGLRAVHDGDDAMRRPSAAQEGANVPGDVDLRE